MASADSCYVAEKGTLYFIMSVMRELHLAELLPLRSSKNQKNQRAALYKQVGKQQF